MGQECALIGKSAPFPGLPHAIVADNVTIDGICMSVGDIVLFSSTPGKIVACAQEGEDFSIVVDVLALHSRLSRHSANYAFEGRRAVWDATKVKETLAWRQSPGQAGCVTILLR